MAALWARISTKIDTAVPSRAGTSLQDTSGRPNWGRPPGTGPSVATPWLARSQYQLMAMAPITASSAPGILGVMRLVPRMTTRTPAETAKVVRLVWSRLPRVDSSLPMVLSNRWPPTVTPDPSGMPSMPPTWPQATWMPTPVRKPMSTVRDRKSARNPMPMSRASSRKPAAIRARSPARATYWDVPDTASPASPAAITAAVAESAPTTRWRDEPSRAKASRGRRIV